MELKENAKRIISGMLGPDISNQISVFDDPNKYPKDFLDECIYFLGKFIGDDAARKKFEPLYKKYVKNPGNKRPTQDRRPCQLNSVKT